MWGMNGAPTKGVNRRTARLDCSGPGSALAGCENKTLRMLGIVSTSHTRSMRSKGFLP